MQTKTRFCLTQPVVLQKARADSTVRAFHGSVLTTQVGESLLCSFLSSDLSRKPESVWVPRWAGQRLGVGPALGEQILDGQGQESSNHLAPR